jgi:GT2 family glycosyltransferase
MAARPLEVSVVVVSWNCRDYVDRCLASLVGDDDGSGRDDDRDAAGDASLEVIVVDNGSHDDIGAMVHERYPSVRFIEMGTNAGFGRANNAGFAMAAGRRLVVLNPDTVVEPGTLDLLADFLDRHPLAGVAAPRMLNPDGSDQATARSLPTPAAALFGRRSPLTRLFPKNPWSSRFLSGRAHSTDEPFRSDFVSAAAMMVDRSVLDWVGGFDEEFFLYWEDADWCRRIAEAGFEIWTVPKAQVVHDEGGSRHGRWPVRVVGHFHRGAYLYWRNHHAPQWWNPLRWAAALGLTMRAIAVIARETTRTGERDHEPAV